MSDRVLVTGISGFVGGHVALDLLRNGYSVRGSIRNPERAEEVREMLAAAGAETDRLEFVTLDLTSDTGWAEAMEGVRYLQHVASPFVTTMPDDPMEIIRPAVNGTERALNAALSAGVERVVLTSSMVAVMHGHPRDRTAPYTADDWTDPSAPDINAYVKSKTLAERRAWEIMAGAGRKPDLTTINPGIILGPLLGRDIGTSGALIRRMLDGSAPAAPRFRFPTADVRDLAELHRLAMMTDSAAGQRILVGTEPVSLLELARITADTVPARRSKAPKFEMPDWLVRVYAWFDSDVRANISDLGRRHVTDSSAAERLLGRPLTPARISAAEMARSLERLGEWA